MLEQEKEYDYVGAITVYEGEGLDYDEGYKLFQYLVDNNLSSSLYSFRSYSSFRELGCNKKDSIDMSCYLTRANEFIEAGFINKKEERGGLVPC